MMREEMEAAYSDKPNAFVDDIGGGEEYAPVGLVDSSLAQFRSDEEDDEREAEA